MSYELRVERLIDATPEEVFNAYTDPEAQKIWYTILDEGMLVENHVDLRVGGKWVSEWGYTPEETFREVITFQVIERPRRLVYQSSLTSPDGSKLDTDVEVTFRDESGKTMMTVAQSGFPDEAIRDFVANTAWIGAFERINAYFAARVGG